MIKQQTTEKLRTMRLSAMADAYENQTRNHEYDALSFDERLSMLVDAEHHKRRTNRVQRAIRTAAFRFPNACIEGIEYHEDRQLDKSLITQLSSCNFIHQGRHILLEGAAGSGKTYLSNALGLPPAGIRCLLGT